MRVPIVFRGVKTAVNIVAVKVPIYVGTYGIVVDWGFCDPVLFATAALTDEDHAEIKEQIVKHINNGG